MNIRYIIKFNLLLVVCLIVSSQLVYAGSIKKRMKQRLPEIAKLKKKGTIGENNRGYLGFVTSARDQKKLVADENKDRKKIYTHFAKQQKTTVDVVEKIQAKRKADKTKPGQYFQKMDGKWVKK